MTLAADRWRLWAGARAQRRQQESTGPQGNVPTPVTLPLHNRSDRLKSQMKYALTWHYIFADFGLVPTISMTYDTQSGHHCRRSVKEAIEKFRTDRDTIRITPEQIETVLSDVIRRVSGQEATVGSNLLSVTLMRPDLGASGSHFLPSTPHFARLLTAGGEQTISVAHTPWTIGPGILYPPSAQVGDWDVNLGASHSASKAHRLRGAFMRSVAVSTVPLRMGSESDIRKLKRKEMSPLARAQNTSKVFALSLVHERGEVFEL